MKDYYAILGVHPQASEEDIKKSFWELAKKWHPDRVPPQDKKQAEEKFKEISEAYHVLTRARNQYEKGFIPEDIFDEVKKEWEKVYAHFENLKNLFTEFEESLSRISKEFEETQLDLIVLMRIFFLLVWFFVSFLLTKHLDSQSRIFVIVLTVLLTYSLSLILDIVFYKKIMIKPGMEIARILKMFRNKIKKKKKTESKILLKK